MFIYYIDWALTAKCICKIMFLSMQPLLNNLIKTNKPMIHRALLVKNWKVVLQNKSFIGNHTLSYINLLYWVILIMDDFSGMVISYNTYYKVHWIYINISFINGIFILMVCVFLVPNLGETHKNILSSIYIYRTGILSFEVIVLRHIIS